MRRFFIILSFCILASGLSAQTLINLKSITKPITNDTIHLDTLSVVSTSIQFYDLNMNKIEGLDYRFDFEKSILIFNKKPDLDSINILYKTFPINFFTSISLLEKDNFLISNKNYNSDYEYIFSSEDYRPSYYNNSLSRKGSISRGVSFGNNQDVVVNSNLNLQLDGKLSNDLYITAAISDNNIPIQPDGTSQQLQEFDKVFIKLYNDKISLIAGDFELKKPKGYFLNYNKKAQGGNFSIKGNIENKNGEIFTVQSSISGAVAKGKLRRQEIKGVEGNQGPYKLSGTNNETFIIILAGTERVYIDGILITRGQDRDYIIDYNLGEISFTSSQPINKDKRIIIEFEYSDRNYTRFLITSSNTISFNKTNLWLNIYDESDNKNQPFDQDLSIAHRKLLSKIGDNLDMAIVPGFDSVNFETSEIRYMMTDTLVNGISYDSIFIYSTNPENAFYRISFSFVGANKGNYKKGISAANGRVYEWVSPLNGIPQGEYIPYKQIITPQKSQVITIGGESEINKKTSLNFEFGFSNNDINTFSKIDSFDDKGYALKFGLKQDIIKTENNYLGTNLNFEFLDRNFKAIENFRSPEFTRDWNLQTFYSSNNENIINGELVYSNKKYGSTSYNISYLNRVKEYDGIKNTIISNLKIKTWSLSTNASLLNSDDILYKTNFLRHNIQLTKELKVLKFGIKELVENNLWKISDNDSIASNSFSFKQYEAFISTNDTLKNKFSLSYKYREDNAPNTNMLKKSTTAQDMSFSTELNPDLNHRIGTTLTYRNLKVNDSSLYSGNSENNLIGKVEYNFKLLKGLATSSSFYEIGSGLERKTEFSFLEVAPGQGVFTWTDYNSNNIQELDEFEVAYYTDQANFIRIISPTAEYIKTYFSQINQNLNINPEVRWKNKKGILKVLSKFSNQFVHSISQKNTSNKLLEYANPFYNDVSQNKLVNLSSSLRNNLSFNRSNPKFGIDYIIQSNTNKMLLVSGFDTRNNFSHNLLVKYNFNVKIGLQNKIGIGDKSYSSEFFSNKNYKIDNKFNEFQFVFQPNLNNRISTKYNYKTKDNSTGLERLTINDIGIDYRLSSIKKGTLNITFNYIHYSYIGETSNSIAYEMLEGLLPGSNLTWSVNFQRQLSNGLQINLNYNARKSNDTKIIHTGGVQIRAFF